MKFKYILFLCLFSWITLITIDYINKRPSPVIMCMNFCLPSSSRYTEQYEPTNSMNFKKFKYCICE